MTKVDLWGVQVHLCTNHVTLYLKYALSVTDQPVRAFTIAPAVFVAPRGRDGGRTCASVVVTPLFEKKTADFPRVNWYNTLPLCCQHPNPEICLTYV